jgi:hypothetical protein
MSNQRSMTSPKEQKLAPSNPTCRIYIYKLPNKGFKIIILKKLTELLENIDK